MINITELYPSRKQIRNIYWRVDHHWLDEPGVTHVAAIDADNLDVVFCAEIDRLGVLTSHVLSDRIAKTDIEKWEAAAIEQRALARTHGNGRDEYKSPTQRVAQ